MKKLLKYGAIVIGVILLLAFIVPFLIPADTYKKYIVKEVENRIAGKLEVGSMRIKIVPLPGFDLKEVKLSNTTGKFAGEPIVLAKEISGSVRLMPLFSKKAIVTLDLISPEVYFSTAKDGRTNIDDLLEEKQETGSRRQEAGETASGVFIANAYADDASSRTLAPKPSSDWKVMVAGFEIEDGLVKITKDGEIPLEIKQLDFKLSDFSPDSSKAVSPVHLAVALFGSEKQNFKIDGKLNADLKGKTAEIKEWKVVIGEAAFDLNGNVNFGDNRSAHVELKLPGSNIGSMLAFDPRLYSQVPSDVSKAALNKMPLSIDINGDYADDSVKINKLAVALGGTKISASGSVSTKEPMPADIKATISPLKIGELKSLLPALKAMGEVSDPSMSLRISGPASNPKSLSVSGHIESAKVKYQGYEISNLKSDIRYTPSKITLASLTGNLYGGSLKGSGSLGLVGESAYDADVSVSNIDMSQVPATKELLKGHGTLNVKADGKGTDEAAIKKNLKAQGNINLANGDIPSLKLGEKIFGSPAWNILAGPGIIINQRGLAELRSLDASCKDFSATFSIANGVINTPNVKWQHPKYSVTLDGSVTMDQQLDYAGAFALSRQTTDALITNQTAKSILVNKSGELNIPFNVGGTTSSPSVRPDEKYLASLFTKVITEYAAQKAVDTVKDVVGGSLPNPGKQLLKGLFGK
ncbi:MAG: hypothetical protein COV46_07615 [Deltaproteobacteria bacterium CG11_big_fil_rev_8_21_14_0_20_49_13]|nr:MAG: hypothetical protein COV46_07615 [Deltaproteobacteria bacterium CG11_big_fil_rev_8_21_14_0_20_49_13]